MLAAAAVQVGMCFLRELQLKAFCEADNALYHLCRLLTAQINTSTVSHIRLWDLNHSSLCGKSLQEVSFQHSSPQGLCWGIQSTMQVFSLRPVSPVLLLFSSIHLRSYLFIEKGIWTPHTHCVCVYACVCLNRVKYSHVKEGVMAKLFIATCERKSWSINSCVSGRGNEAWFPAELMLKAEIPCGFTGV